MSTEFAIVDLFAGPGGLAEGFSSIRNRDGSRPFQIALSVEKEASAFETLRFRSFFRQFNGSPPSNYYSFLNGEIPEPDWKSLFPVQWERACLETVRLELGSPLATQEIDTRLVQITKDYGGDVILIGGPPCQAYSLVGRARNKGTKGYDASKDHRHFLYKEYIRILQKLKPAAFVMENVKGLLSSSVNGEGVLDQVLDDLSRVSNASYRLVPLAPRSRQSLFDQEVRPPAFDFVVRAEDHGIPQSRHRVIVVGIRADIAASVAEHASENERGRRGHIAAVVAQLIDVFALHAHGVRQRAFGQADRLHEFLDQDFANRRRLAFGHQHGCLIPSCDRQGIHLFDGTLADHLLICPTGKSPARVSE